MLCLMRSLIHHVQVPNPVTCNVCNTTMNGPEPAAAHFAGAQHKARAAGMRPRITDY
jgi:hypothetical protein